jgi:HSP20 family protein
MDSPASRHPPVLGWLVAFTRWDPLQDLLALQERIHRLSGTDEAGWMPPVDIYETQDRYVVTAEVSGLLREDLQIQLQDGKLTLRGERRSGEASAVRFERVERGHGRFMRAFVLPHAVDASAVTADLQNGVLTILVPKTSDRHQVEID